MWEHVDRTSATYYQCCRSVHRQDLTTSIMKSDSHLLPLHHALRGFARPSCTVPVEQQLHELQVMLAAGISPQSADADGLTPLEVAAQTGHSSAVHLLCAAEHAPPLEQCSRGLLHAVAFKGLSATKCGASTPASLHATPVAGMQCCWLALTPKGSRVAHQSHLVLLPAARSRSAQIIAPCLLCRHDPYAG